MNLYILTLWYKKIFIFNTFRTTLLNLFSHAHIYDIFRIIKKFLLFINILSRQKVFQSHLLGFWRGNFHLPCNIRALMNPPCHPRSFSSSPACQPAFPRACLHAGRFEKSACHPRRLFTLFVRAPAGLPAGKLAARQPAWRHHNAKSRLSAAFCWSWQTRCHVMYAANATPILFRPSFRLRRLPCPWPPQIF